MKKIAFFDFDGTITTKDTLFEIIKHQKGNTRFYLGFLINIPVLVALKLKLLSNQTAKELFLKTFFNGADLTKFQSHCDDFVDTKLSGMIRPGAGEEIKKLKESGFEVVIVSASAENWIKKWAEQMNVGLIATRLHSADQKITGKISGLNCSGPEKEARIRAKYNLAEFTDIYCYGDSIGDREMLALGTKSFFEPFR